MLKALALLCTLALVISGCGTLSNQQATLPSQAAQCINGVNVSAEVDLLAEPLIKQGITPGIVVGVLTPDGEKHFFGYGTVETFIGDTHPNRDTLFAVGSVSKGFMAVAAALLVQDGTLQWDETLAKLLPNTPLSADAQKITLVQLVTHSSGLPRQPMTPQTLRYFVEYLFTGNSFYRHFDEAYILNYLNYFDAPARPTTQYSNIGYAVLSYILESHSGLSIEDLIAHRVTGPLSLHSTAYDLSRIPDKANIAIGHAGDQPKFIRRGTPVPDWQFSTILNGAAGLHSSADDLLAFAAANLNGVADTQLNAALQDTLQPRLAGNTESPALAWFVDTAGSKEITYQVGFVAGFSSYIGLSLEDNTAVVVLENSFNWNNGALGHSLLMRMHQSCSKTTHRL